MKLRQAKKIFNRTAAYESGLLHEFDSFIRAADSQEDREYTLRMFHRMAAAFCGYTDKQVNAACNRLGRHLNKHPNFRPEFLAK